MATWLDGISIVVALACELERDWAREETVADVIEIVVTERLLKTRAWRLHPAIEPRLPIPRRASSFGRRTRCSHR
jgi:hypothetical protein